MGTTSEELKKLYVKLGGKDPKVASFSAPGEILNAINEIPLPTEYELPTVTTEDAGDVLVVNEEGKWDKGEAGGGLPEVTTDDNGDILQVVEGAWAKAAMSDNVVILRAKTEGNYVSIQNITVAQIAEYISKGKVVFVVYEEELLWFSGSGANYMYGVRRTNLAKVDVSYYDFISAPAKYRKAEGFAFPAAGSTNNGKVLTVKNGEWSAENPPASLPEVTAADNGDVLQVVDGAWAKAANSGVVTIEATLETSGSSRWLSFSNYTQKQIYDLAIACNFGVKIVVHQQNGSGVYVYYPQIGLIDTNISFLCIYRGPSATTFDTVTFGNKSLSTTVSITRKEIADPT